MDKVKKTKDSLVTGRGGPWNCETTRIAHFLDNSSKDGGGCLPYAPAALYYQRRFLVLISVIS
jgi:hypothetical protein